MGERAVPRPLIGTSEAAARIGCYPGDLVRVYVRSGELPGYKLPRGRWRFKPEDVEAFVEAHRVVDPSTLPGFAERAARRADLARRSVERNETLTASQRAVWEKRRVERAVGSGRRDAR